MRKILLPHLFSGVDQSPIQSVGIRIGILKPYIQALLGLFFMGNFKNWLSSRLPRAFPMGAGKPDKKVALTEVQMNEIETTTFQDVMRILLGAIMIYAAIGHFSFLRKEFAAQVPDWVPFDKDTVVILSGVVELILGLAMIFAPPYKVWVGIALAIFYVLIFPGNIAQYKNRNKAFGLKTDKARSIRLFFQPVLILWALWSTGALEYLLN